MSLNWFVCSRTSNLIWLGHRSVRTSWVAISAYLIFSHEALSYLSTWNSIMIIIPRPLCSLLLSSQSFFIFSYTKSKRTVTSSLLPKLFYNLYCFQGITFTLQRKADNTLFILSLNNNIKICLNINLLNNFFFKKLI